MIKNGDQIEEEEEEEEIDYSINDNNNNGTEDCLYDGVISSGNVQGKVAFSACGKQQGFVSFTMHCILYKLIQAFTLYISLEFIV